MTSVPKLRVEVSSQLEELRGLALRGQNDVVNCGPIIVIWGVAISAAALTEHFSGNPALALAAWLVSISLAYIATVIAARLSRADRRSVTWRSYVLNRVWLACGAAIVLFNLGEALHGEASAVRSMSEAATALMLSIAALTTAELAKQRVPILSGIGWILVGAALFVAPPAALLPILSGAAVGLQIVPGLILMRER